MYTTQKNQNYQGPGLTHSGSQSSLRTGGLVEKIIDPDDLVGVDPSQYAQLQSNPGMLRSLKQGSDGMATFDLTNRFNISQPGPQYYSKEQLFLPDKDEVLTDLKNALKTHNKKFMNLINKASAMAIQPTPQSKPSPVYMQSQLQPQFQSGLQINSNANIMGPAFIQTARPRGESQQYIQVDSNRNANYIPLIQKDSQRGYYDSSVRIIQGGPMPVQDVPYSSNYDSNSVTIKQNGSSQNTLVYGKRSATPEVIVRRQPMAYMEPPRYDEV
jgi:hypothetical protein